VARQSRAVGGLSEWCQGAVNTLDRRRGRTDCLHQPLDQARIDRETLQAMLGAMADSFPAFRRYFQHKAVLLGKEALPWWDLFAPVGTPAGATPLPRRGTCFWSSSAPSRIGC